MVFQSPGDICFRIFGFPVYNYGITMALACFVGVYISYLMFKKYNSDKDYEIIWDFAVWILLFGIIGARLYYCFLNYEYYAHFPLQIMNIRQGGLSVHGGIIGGVLAIMVGARKYKLPLLNLLDSFACGTCLAQAVGRWGNFFNSEAFGYPTNLPWKLYIPIEHRPSQYIDYEFFHPTFLYEGILDVLLFAVLYFCMKKFAKLRSGATFGFYLILYSVIRLFVESFRVDSALDVLGVPIAKIVSVILIFIGTVILISTFSKKQAD